MSQVIANAIAAAAHQLEPRVIARLGGDFGARVTAALAELAAIPVDKRKLKRALWAATARTPIPAGFRNIHASWVEAALEPLPTRARTDVASGGIPRDGGNDPVSVWLARRACAAMPIAMPQVKLATTVDNLDAMFALPAASLESWLENVGAEQIALLAIASKTIDLVMRRPDDYGIRIRAAVKRIWPFFRKDLLGTPLAAITKRCASTPLEARGLLRIGARALAPHVATRLGGAAIVAHRLPHATGAIALRELQAHAAAPLASVPTWRVLAQVGIV